MICIFGLFHGLILLPAVLCLVGPTDEEKKPEKRGVTKSELNGHGPKASRLSFTVYPNESEKYLQENEQNLQTESEELGVPLTSEISWGNLRETDLL